LIQHYVGNPGLAIIILENGKLSEFWLVSATRFQMDCCEAEMGNIFEMLNISDWPLPVKEQVFDYLRYNSYRSERYNLFYVATPKVACTTLKWWFAALEGYTQALRGITDSAETAPDLIVHESHKVAPNVTGLIPEALLEALTSDSYFRFAVVRNPYKRIFSAWQSKLLLQEPLQVGPYLQCDFFHHPIKSAGDIAEAFEEFLEHLASNEAPSYWDHHWTPQAALLRPDLINYSKLAKVENSDELSQALAGWLGKYIPDPFASRPTNESLIPYLPEFVTERSAELIRTLYAEDFDAFGYDRQPPKIKETLSTDQLDLALKAITLIRGRHQRLGERNRQVASLTQAVTERDGQIASLTQAVTEREGQIASLTQAVTEREGQIASLTQALNERDGQVANLTQALNERDGQVATLTQAVTEREGQIASLTQALNERDGQVATLTQAVTERDGQIASLTQAVTEREGQIADLRHEGDRIVIGKDWEIRVLRQQLNHILSSRLWRVTAPSRKLAGTIRKGVRSLRMSYLGQIVQCLRSGCGVFLGSSVRQIRDSSLFDAEYYLANNPDVRNAGPDPAKHYLIHGWKEGRDPSAAFSTPQYLFDNPDVARARVNPLVHYLRYGRLEGRPIGPQTSALGSTSSPASVHSASVSHQALHQALVEVGDLPITLGHESVSNAAIDAEIEAIRKSGLFDEHFYRSMYTDLQGAPCDLIRHYCEHGWRQGRNPSDDFDTRFYLATYSDIRNAGINPFWHYVVAGASEMRHAIPDLATRYEDDIWFGAVDTDIKLLAFYSSPDWSTMRGGRPLFKGHSRPALPHDDFGFYDPSDLRVLKQQAELAKRHGLYGFCFDLGFASEGGGYAQPVESFLGHDDIDFRFCVQAELSSEDVLAPLVASIVRAVSDRRHIRIADRPLVLLMLPDDRMRAANVLDQLRRRLADQGVGSPFLVGRWAPAGDNSSGASLADLCDAVLDLPSAPVPGETGDFLPADKNGVDVVPYSVVASQGVVRARKAHGSAYPLYHVVTLGRDNTAQSPVRPLVYNRFHVRDYRRWLDEAIAGARVAHPEDRRFVFVNGWNDWNVGLFLEPDRQGGFCRVNETTRALLNISPGAAMPKVSVIVPNYNHEPFLRRRLDSIYGQTYKNIEVILLDDCSSDQSRPLMDQYAAAHPEITRTVYNDENSGSAFRQWAKGIKAATGDLVWIAESDDYCDERFLEVLVRCFEDEAVLLAYAKSTFVDKNEVPIRDDFKSYLSDLVCAEKWNGSYVETAHNEVKSALGIKNTIPNASGVLFKRPINMPLLADESWLSMVVAGDWIFYLQIIRGGKIAYSTETTNFFRRYEGSAAEVTYKKEVFYREVGMASRTVAALYDVPLAVLEQSRRTYRTVYENKVGGRDEEFALWFDYQSILNARDRRLPNVMVSTMGSSPAEPKSSLSDWRTNSNAKVFQCCC
jgi:glycosyltransferase involved in cell wall biosynthesis